MVIDPLSAYFDGNIQSNNDSSVRGALAPLVEVAQRTGAAILLVRHLNKDVSKGALYRGAEHRHHWSLPVGHGGGQGSREREQKGARMVQDEPVRVPSQIARGLRHF